MKNGGVKYGYSIQNSRAAIDEEQADRIRKIYDGYLSGLSYVEAAKATGIELTHSTVKRMLQDRHYLGDDFYPAIIDEETFAAAEEERQRRSRRLGRDNLKRLTRSRHVPVKFKLGAAADSFKDPYEQAAYVYSLIESEE